MNTDTPLDTISCRNCGETQLWFPLHDGTMECGQCGQLQGDPLYAETKEV